MTMLHLTIIEISLAVSLLFVAWFFKKPMSENKKYKGIYLALMTIGAIFSTGTLTALTVLTCRGIQKGADWNDYKGLSYRTYITYASDPGIQPVDKTITELEMPSLTVWSRFGCIDCLYVLPYLEQDAKQENIPLYHISSDSDNGKILRETYPIESVPMLMYLNENGKAFYCSPVIETDNEPEYNRDQALSFLRQSIKETN